jgi:predicted MFS family arabinose efflux permease
MPDWARGRMNAAHMMASQGGVALGGILWGTAATSIGLGRTLLGGALLLTVSLALAIRLFPHKPGENTLWSYLSFFISPQKMNRQRKLG